MLFKVWSPTCPAKSWLILSNRETPEETLADLNHQFHEWMDMDLHLKAKAYKSWMEGLQFDDAIVQIESCSVLG